MPKLSMRLRAWVTDAIYETALQLLAPTAFFLVFVVAVRACPAHAQEACAPNVVLRRAPLEHQGHPGVWFDLEVARCMLGDLSELEAVRTQARLLEQRATLRDEQAASLREAVRLGDLALGSVMQAVQAAEGRAARAETALDSPLRSPWLWLGVGTAAGIGLVLLATVLVGGAS